MEFEVAERDLFLFLLFSLAGYSYCGVIASLFDISVGYYHFVTTLLRRYLYVDREVQ